MANTFPAEPAYDASVVTPSDTGALTACRSLFVGGAGDVRVLTSAGNDVTFTGVVAGSILPIKAARVYSTSTTATNIVALF